MVTVGVRAGLSIDHLVMVDRRARFDQLGGPGLYGTLGARLVDGTSTSLFASLPADDNRFAVLFADLGVDIEYCQTVPKVPRVWILNAREGRRIVAISTPGGVEIEGGTAVGDKTAVEGKNDEGEPMYPPTEFYQQLDALFESSPVDAPRPEHPITIGIDPHQIPLRAEGFDYVERVTPPGSVLLPSRVHLLLLGKDPRRAARELAARTGGPVVARLDTEGMYIVSSNGNWSVRDSAVNVVETTGAGDSSAAAIVSALAIGADLVTAARFGASVARLALSGWGHSGLLRSEPLTAPLNNIESKQEL